VRHYLISAVYGLLVSKYANEAKTQKFLARVNHLQILQLISCIFNASCNTKRICCNTLYIQPTRVGRRHTQSNNEIL